jgi:cytochrome c peroxidase
VRRSPTTLLVAASLPVIVALSLARAVTADRTGTNLLPFPNPSGLVHTEAQSGVIDTQNPFFQSLGTNGRSCFTCHQPEDAWSITPAHLQARFEATEGLDPVFRTNDGSNSPLADVSTVAQRRAAYSMLLKKGLIRVGLPIPENAEFSLAEVDDPYGFATARELSLFRRPLPATNLRFLTGVMWDSRQSHPGFSLEEDLKSQVIDATLGHAEARSAPTDEEVRQIVAFELDLYTAQVYDRAAGLLTEAGARGGPAFLIDQAFFLGINDPLGQNPTGAPHDPAAVNLFNAWDSGHPGLLAGRQAVARGQSLFNTKEFTVSGVPGVNDVLGIPKLTATCTTCHDAPNVGNHSVAFALDLGVGDASRRAPDMPLYTFANNKTGERMQTTDPGRALVTGKWQDIGKFKGPILRGVAGRAPYFHNGSAPTLDEVVHFYEGRFNIGLSDEERADLVAFLRTL